MTNLRIIISLIKKDLLYFFRNKTILIVIILPVLASIFFLLIETGLFQIEYNLGLITENNLEIDSSNYQEINFIKYQNLEQARDNLDTIDGFMELKADNQFKLYLNKLDPTEMLVIERYLNQIIISSMNYSMPFELDIELIDNQSPFNDLISLWLAITVAMIGIVVMSGDLAEEKDNKTLEGIYIAPISNKLFLSSKIISGTILALITAIRILIFNLFIESSLTISSLLLTIPVLLAGALIFNIIGIIIGLKSKSQSSARSLATIIYFIVVFPGLLAAFSPGFEFIGRITPTYYLIQGLQLNNILTNLIFLLVFTGILSPYLLYSYKEVYYND
ncbi:MAG: ABC transporter permease [Halarsenatibacteraceae bacterium]